MKDLFNFGGKVAYKKQAETRRPTDYDYLFKLLLVGDSGMPCIYKFVDYLTKFNFIIEAWVRAACCFDLRTTNSSLRATYQRLV